MTIDHAMTADCRIVNFYFTRLFDEAYSLLSPFLTLTLVISDESDVNKSLLIKKLIERSIYD